MPVIEVFISNGACQKMNHKALFYKHFPIKAALEKPVLVGRLTPSAQKSARR
jgi:hypothetical protein